jgi:hypothetical protein
MTVEDRGVGVPTEDTAAVKSPTDLLGSGLAGGTGASRHEATFLVLLRECWVEHPELRGIVLDWCQEGEGRENWFLGLNWAQQKSREPLYYATGWGWCLWVSDGRDGLFHEYTHWVPAQLWQEGTDCMAWYNEYASREEAWRALATRVGGNLAQNT